MCFVYDLEKLFGKYEEFEYRKDIAPRSESYCPLDVVEFEYTSLESVSEAEKELGLCYPRRSEEVDTQIVTSIQSVHDKTGATTPLWMHEMTGDGLSVSSLNEDDF